MDTAALGVMALMGGGFLLGMWYILVRKDAKLNMRPGMTAEGLRQGSGAPSFGQTKQEIDRKLALVENRRRRQQIIDSRLAVQEAELIAAQQSRLLEEEAERERLRREEQRRLAEEAENRRREEESRQREEAEESERRRVEEDARLTRERAEEESRLEAEREELRQLEMAAAEEQRLAELEAARLQEEMESRAAAEAAMSELQSRLSREGAKSGDVQISLMWENYNDLDLHVVCPSGERIHGGNKVSECGGELDVDANVRAETKKPVENVVWEGTTAPPGTYQVYVHHYKKHRKRRTRDPTKFQIIINNVGDFREYHGDLTHGDPIKLVCQFDVPERDGQEDYAKRQMELKMRQEAEESERLENERAEEERQRQSEMAAVEEQRLAEVELARQQEEMESRQAAENAMSELQQRLDREGARSGDVQVSLMWNNYNDLDLHVVCPSGERIHGGNKISECGGELDVDANVRPDTKKPVENVVWDDDTAKPGMYQVYVHHYKKHNKRRSKDPTKFQVIVNNIGDLLEFNGALTHGDPIKLIAQFEVPSAEERRVKLESIRAQLDMISKSSSEDSEEELEEVEVQLEEDGELGN
ncbi:MAG: hypothetical protein P8Q95_01670 [Candidatus Poseidoniaceae archaeon]|nr:hypothetical protein [Candidatus Poseidoniaceae archaeon]